LRPRRVVAERISAEGTVRGRLDGLSAPALLKIVCQTRPDSALSIRDANYAYEIKVRSGRPVMATRTHVGGATERGPEVMAALLGIGAGRFGVTSTPEGQAFSAELEGALDEQLLEPIARVRAAQGLMSGHRLIRIEKVILDERSMAVQLRATPEPSRGLLRALVAGVSPRELISAGRASADLVERVLCYAARQGAVRGVFGVQGYDLLPDAVERDLAVLSGEADDETVRASRAAMAPGGPGAEVALVLNAAAYADDDHDEPEDVSSSGPIEVLAEADLSPPPSDPLGLADDEAEETAVVAALADDADGLPGPLGGRSRPREQRASSGHTPVLASALEVSEHARHHTPALSRVVDNGPRFASLEDDRQAVVPAPRSPEPAPEPAPKASLPDVVEPVLPRLPMPSAWATRGPEPPPPPRKSAARFLLPILFGVIGIGLAIGARWYREQQPVMPPPAPQQLQAPVPTIEGPQSPTTTTGMVTPAATAELPVELPLSDQDAAKLKEGVGILEVVAGRDDVVYIGGERVGKGPVVKVPLMAQNEPYEVRVKLRGEQRVRYVIVKAGKRLRLRVAPPWSR